MKWDEMLDMPLVQRDGQVLTDIECPQCGRNVYLNTGIILTTYPAKYSYWCTCGWNGYSHIRWCYGLERRPNDQ